MVDSIELQGALLEDFLVRQNEQLAKENAELIGRVAELEKRVYIDSLTGLYNRAFFDNEIIRMFDSRLTEPLSVMVVDVNSFKGINDRHGHDAGDRALALVGKALTRSVRSMDYVIRYGGDEFLIVFSHEEEEVDMCRVVVRIRDHVQALSAESGIGFSVSASCGFAKRRDGESVGELLKQADADMYGFKRLSKLAL